MAGDAPAGSDGSRYPLPMRWGRRSDSAAGKPSLWMRFQTMIVRPDDDEGDAAAKKALAGRSLDELEAESRTLSDRERLIGFVIAPIAAALTFFLTTVLVDDDPVPTLSNGNPNPAHVDVSLYHELFFVLVGMSILIMLTTFLRKRLLLGLVTALFGLGLFNLHYWGFGLPFIFAGAWFLVRAYRLQQSVKVAGGDGSARGAYKPKARGLPSAGGSLPRPSKRYTPRTAQPKRPPKD